jgi:uncharacterized protein with PIN domain
MQNIDKEEEKKVVRRKFHVCLLCNNMLILPSKSKIVEIIIGWK